VVESLDGGHVEPGASFGLYRHETLPSHWIGLWAATPDRVVVESPSPLLARDLMSRSAEVACGLLAAGLRPGDRVILSAAASIDVVVAYVAMLRAGLVVVPVNTAYREREIGHILADSGARAAIADSDEMAGWIGAADAGIRVFRPEGPFPDGDASRLDRSTPEQLAMICYTSGTTGTPKGAMLLHQNLMACAEAVTLAWRWRDSDCLILALPLFHLHGLGVGLNGTLFAGGRMILLERFSADAVLAAADRATLFFGVPTMYQRLLDHSEVGRLRRLRLCVSGSAPLPAAFHLEFMERTGQRILERYGMTETLMNVSHRYDGDRRAGTVGYPLPGVEMRLAEGRKGEISLRGPNVFAGYWGNAEATREVLSEDGWFRTGDVGELDEDGQLRLVARTKELIISGGYNVYPREVEDVLRAVPGVRDAAVVGVPSLRWGETVIAYVEGDFEDAALHGMAERGLAAYKRPKVVLRIENLPRNALGKVTKHVLRDMAIRDGILGEVST
jgi:malonyl-CoA/methylmalonyl-CoA synthetase